MYGIRTTRRALALASLLATATACRAGEEPTGSFRLFPEPGATDFVSADDPAAPGGSRAPAGEDDFAAAPGENEGEGGDRTVEEGDVYRALGDGLLLNLNGYRGLQVIDLSDPGAPAIVGRLRVTGTPVELYVSGDHAWVLLNDWRGYWGSRHDAAVETWQGGVALSVDLSDPAAPRIVDRELVPGWIRVSRLVRGGGQEALYVVSQEWNTGAGTPDTRVTSFALAGGRLTPADALELGGWVTDVAATPEALLVAREDWQSGRSRVSIVDISDPAGTMIEGAEIQTEGRVESQFNMDLRGGILRVVSANSWASASNTNHLETFDASNLHQLTRIDHETFGANEDLYATIFLDEAAFCVTYRRVDPFHAFHVSPTGDVTAMSEFVVSGWNDFFRAVLGGTRLIGIGTDDQASWTTAVSLYDVTDLANPRPLVARAVVEAQGSWSAASWDHRAFSVIEDAVAIQAPTGELETGLVLLPFNGWNAADGHYTASVQIFTFSATTLTRRGKMEHGSPVHRSFRAAPDTAAHLSQEALSLFDVGDPDAPAELGRVALAPSFTDVIPFGDHLVRLRAPAAWSGWGANRPAEMQVLPPGADPDTGTPVARFDVPAAARLHRVGHLLAAVTGTWQELAGDWKRVTEIRLFDLSDPAAPVERGSLVTDRITAGGGAWYGLVDCMGDCGRYGGWQAFDDVHVVGQALAFVESEPRYEEVGPQRVCYEAPRDRGTCSGAGWADGCTIQTGGRTCIDRGRGFHCTGTIRACVYDADEASFACTDVDPDVIDLERSCHDGTAWRSWNAITVEVVDLRDPDHPALAPTVALAPDDEGVGAVAAGTDLWLSYKRPVTVPGDPRPWVRYFVRRLELADPAHPVLRTQVNVPGELLAVEGATLYTRDRNWNGDRVDSAVARLRLSGPVALLEAHRPFTARDVETIALDGAGQLLVSHRSLPAYGAQAGHALTILDAGSPRLDELATVEVDTWARLADARVGRALFQVPGGLLVFNLDVPAQPWPQAWFATWGWPHRLVVDGRRILFAAGPYGVHAFDVDEANLPAP